MSALIAKNHTNQPLLDALVNQANSYDLEADERNKYRAMHYFKTAELLTETSEVVICVFDEEDYNPNYSYNLYKIIGFPDTWNYKPCSSVSLFIRDFLRFAIWPEGPDMPIPNPILIKMLDTSDTPKEKKEEPVVADDEEEDEEDDEEDDDEIKLIDTEDDITVEELYQALTKMLQKNPSYGKKIVKHVEFGGLHDTRVVHLDSKYLVFAEY
jgi:hypothetical protein